MTKILNGSELVDYIKERQARQVRGLRQAWNIFPRLAILKTPGSSKVITTYVNRKRRYGEDILIQTDIYTCSEDEMASKLSELNQNPEIHGIIVQLPLDDTVRTDEIVNLITPEKDVDGLGSQTKFDSATAVAINWLLAGYGVDLAGRQIAIVGNGRLVGAPLAKMWRQSGFNVTVIDRSTLDMELILRESDVVVTATGIPHLIKTTMLKPGAVVVDAGTASEKGVIVGDLDEQVRLRDDLSVTPKKGGVGPLTVAALFDNVITSAGRLADKKT